MELKRYVLLDNGLIFDTTVDLGHQVMLYKDSGFDNKNYYVGFGLLKVKHNIRELDEKGLGKVKNTNNNILELLEKGDFIQYVRKDGKIESYFIENEVLIGANGDVCSGGYCHGFDKGFNTSMAMFKLQPNGDFKRYEVSK